MGGDPKGFLEEFKLGGWEERNLGRGSSKSRGLAMYHPPRPPGPRYTIYYPGTGPQEPEKETESQGRLEGTEAGHQPGDWLSAREQ